MRKQVTTIMLTLFFNAIHAEPTNGERMTQSLMSLYSAYGIKYELINDKDCKNNRIQQVDLEIFAKAVPFNSEKERVEFKNQMYGIINDDLVKKSMMSDGKRATMLAYEISISALEKVKKANGEILDKCEALNTIANNVFQKSIDNIRQYKP